MMISSVVSTQRKHAEKQGTASSDSKNNVRKEIKIHCVSKNDTALICYNFDVHQPILIIFGRIVAKN